MSKSLHKKLAKILALPSFRSASMRKLSSASIGFSRIVSSFTTTVSAMQKNE